MTAGHATVAVLASRPVWGEAIAAVLERSGHQVKRGDEIESADVALLVEPGASEWARVDSRDCHVIVLVGDEPDGETLLELVSLGACAVLPLSCGPDELVRNVASAATGGCWLTATQLHTLLETLRSTRRASHAGQVELTRREREILLSIERGCSVKQTANDLGISPRTVENTQRLLFRKLGVRNRPQAIARALELHLLDAPTSDGTGTLRA